MPLPAFREDLWLPEGHHPATWEEIVATFGGAPGSKRAQVLANLLEWRDRVRGHGITGRLILDGSFVSAKPDPGDFDTLFLLDEGMEGVLARDEEARRLVDYTHCKERGWGDIFLLPAAAVRKFPQLCHLDLFDHDKVTKQRKGVIEVDL